MTLLPLQPPRALKADGLVDPIGGLSRSPRLSWRHDGESATSFVVIVTAPEWESAVEAVISPDTTHAEWPGPPLEDLQTFSWSVTAVRGDDSAQSDTARGETAFEGRWPGDAITHPEWVTPWAEPAGMPELGITFDVPGEVASARLYLAAAGVVIPAFNGVEAIAGQLEPGYADLDRVTPASAWDVTSRLRSGENELTLSLGGGIAFVPRSAERYAKFDRRGRPVFAQAHLTIRLTDGSEIAISSSPAWRARLGTISVGSWYGGESTSRHAAGAWERVAVVADPAPHWWRSTPAIVVTETLSPVAVTHSPRGALVDFGTNTAGRPLLTLEHAVVGGTITLTPGELVADGKVDQSSTGAPIFDTFTPARSTEQWRPLTVYHGARYLEVDGLSPQESTDAIRFEVLRADNERVGSFSSSDPFLHRLHEIVDRAIQSNMHSVLTDCPHREKLGWLEQLHYVFTPLARNYDVQAQLGDMVEHMLRAQTADGLVPNIAPELVIFNEAAVKGDLDAFRSDPNWGRAVVEVPWRVYQHYGDPRLLETAFPAMLSYLEYLKSRAVDGGIDFGLGDWVEIDDSTPRSLVASHGWALALDTAAKAAKALGASSAERTLRDQAGQVWRSLIRRHRDDRGRWGSGSQGSLALAWGNPLLSDTERELVYSQLLDAITAAGDAFTVGEVSLPFLLDALSTNGANDLLHRIIRRHDVPGYGLQLASGATSLTESWRGAGGTAGVISQNHFMLGAVDAWLLEHVAGLRQAANSVAWDGIVVAPTILDGVDSAYTTFDSPKGRMTVGWERDPEGTVRVTVDVPESVKTSIRLPAGAIIDHVR